MEIPETVRELLTNATLCHLTTLNSAGTASIFSRSRPTFTDPYERANNSSSPINQTGQTQCKLAAEKPGCLPPTDRCAKIQCARRVLNCVVEKREIAGDRSVRLVGQAHFRFQCALSHVPLHFEEFVLGNCEVRVDRIDALNDEQRCRLAGLPGLTTLRTSTNRSPARPSIGE